MLSFSHLVAYRLYLGFLTKQSVKPEFDANCSYKNSQEFDVYCIKSKNRSWTISRKGSSIASLLSSMFAVDFFYCTCLK